MEALIAVTAIGFGVGGPVLAIYLLLLFSDKKTAKKMDTLVKIVEHGGNLEPGMLEMLNEPSGPAADLRKGLIWLAIGIPLTLGIALSEGGTEWVFGLIPVFIGGAYLIVMKVDVEKLSDRQV